MKTSLAVLVWASLVVGSAVEAAIFELNPGNLNVDIVIGLIASCMAVATVFFSMGIKEESTAIRYLFLMPVLLVGVLIITLLLAFPIIQ
jgi:hypothetical protein